jgi:hypothetical protein
MTKSNGIPDNPSPGLPRHDLLKQRYNLQEFLTEWPGRSRQPTGLAKAVAAMLRDYDVIEQFDPEDFSSFTNPLGQLGILAGQS